MSFLIEAELVDSKLGTFPISGGAVILVTRRRRRLPVSLSVGGFNPSSRRPRTCLSPTGCAWTSAAATTPGCGSRRTSAITTETFQFGARAQLHAAAGPLAIDGWLGLDVLVAWLPHFRFSAEISAGLSLSYNGSPILEVSIDVLLEGPGPWHVHGYASLSLLFFTLSLPIDATWGDDSGPTAQTAQPLTLVHDALSSRGRLERQPAARELRPWYLQRRHRPGHPRPSSSHRRLPAAHRPARPEPSPTWATSP